MSNPLVTVLINNYNYGRFLREAIDSALQQTYRKVEVVVVDDGSTDESRDIIASYGKRIIPVLKANGGQASAINAGFAASRGDIICLLDSDDFFHVSKIDRLLPYSSPGSLLYHRLQVEPGPDCIPSKSFRIRNFYRYAQRYRFVPYVGAPTSGLTIRRDLALRLLPLPTHHVRSSADDFIVRGASLIGQVIGIPNVLATYRVHGENAWFGARKPKSPEFMTELETYLNRKLVEDGKRPVINFYNSMYARDAVAQNSGELSRLAFSVFRHHPDLLTLKFMLKTLARSARYAVSPAACATERATESDV